MPSIDQSGKNKGWIDISTLPLNQRYPKVEDELWAAGTESPVDHAARQEAKEFLDNLIENPNYNYATMATQWEGKKQDVVQSTQGLNALFNGLDWSLSAIQGSQEASQEVQDVYSPWGKVAWGCDFLAHTLYHKFLEEPSFSSIIPYGKAYYIQNELNRIDAKINAIKNSDYKYLVYDLYFDHGGTGPNSYFINALNRKIKDLDSKMPQYGTSNDNERYKEAYISYLKYIIDLNERRDYSSIEETFKIIDEYYDRIKYGY
jgi:hypothetical protein